MNARTPQNEHRPERSVAALLALGGFALLSGGVLLLPFLLSPYAIQNDVYLGNLLLAPLVAFGGIVFLLIAAIGILSSSRLRSLRWLWLRPLAIAAVGAAILAFASLVVGGRYESFPPGSLSWPPYLNAPLLVTAALIGVAVTIAGWFWGTGAAGSDRARASHA